MTQSLFLRFCRQCGTRVADHLVNAVHPTLVEGAGPEYATFRYDCEICGPNQAATAFFNITCVDCWKCRHMRPCRDLYCSRCGAPAAQPE